MTAGVESHPALVAKRRAAAVADAHTLAANDRLARVCESLQAELVGQWLKERDPQRRETCWHECRAVEAVRGRLVADLAAELGVAEDKLPEDIGEEELRAATRVAAVEESMWLEPAKRWLRAVRRWRDGR